MSEVIKKLEDWGCDMETTMERFAYNEELFISFLDIMAADENFEGLGRALDNNQVKEAFECAHALKGVLSNMGLDPMTNVIVEIVEPLRAGNIDGMKEKYDRLMELRQEYISIIS